MAGRENDHSTAVPEADRIEQERPADPGVEGDRAQPASPTHDVDEADWLEQSQPVLTDPDEDYTPDPV